MNIEEHDDISNTVVEILRQSKNRMAISEDRYQNRKAFIDWSSEAIECLRKAITKLNR